jgi:hypothetical protein
MASPRARRRNISNSGKAQERRLVNAIDELSEFEQFQAEVAPTLRKLMYRNASTKEISDFVRSRMIARAATIALTSLDEGRALSAIKDVLDRADGKPTETKKIDVNNISDDELNALIKAELAASNTQ